MATTVYFEGTFKDPTHGNEIFLEIGTTTYHGSEQLYIKTNPDEGVTLNDDATKKLLDAFEMIALRIL